MNAPDIIEKLCADLAGHHTNDPAALWEEIAAAFQRLEGRAIDRGDPYEIMLASAVHTRLMPTQA